nr:CIH_HP1_G0023720.mRNA.1.CDS.1 [Saccharomyces cerevisiae]
MELIFVHDTFDFVVLAKDDLSDERKSDGLNSVRKFKWAMWPVIANPLEPLPGIARAARLEESPQLSRNHN